MGNNNYVRDNDDSIRRKWSNPAFVLMSVLFDGEPKSHNNLVQAA